MATSRMETPKGLRLHFGLFGKRNAGKSSLINALANQNISIVSSVAGTTTDPVEKAFELSPIGPVVFMDTAGIDDIGDLGAARVQKSLSVLEWMDIAIVVCEAGTWGEHEENILKKTKLNGTPTIIVFNKTDLLKPQSEQVQTLIGRGYKVVQTSAANREGIDALRDAIIQTVLEKTEPDRPLMGELAKAGDTVILVTPIDTGAPKGRLILPQVQAIRELLDAGANPFANADQAFLTAKTLLLLGEIDRFRALGFPPDLTLPEPASDAAPMSLLGALLEQVLIDLRHDPEASQRALAAANHLLDLGADPNHPVFDGSLTYRDGVWKADNTSLRDLFAKRLAFAHEQFPTPTPAQADALFACQALARRMAAATQWRPRK